MRTKRIPCPVHGGTDANCAIWRDARGRLHAKCWSYNCDQNAILSALCEIADAVPTASHDTGHHAIAARRIWDASRAAKGTIAERYLRARGITIEPPASLHYHPALRHPSGVGLPSLVAAVEDLAGRFVGVHRTWLCADGFDKAAVTPQKAALGPISGGAVRLTLAMAEVVALTEGIETGLSVVQATGLCTWATLGTSGLRSLRLPHCVRRVIIAADADAAGESAALRAAQRFVQEGRQVRIARPEDGKDFNDYLRV
jgi:putative DNA primase/helicase